jgi:predicted metal-dependent hydrolase
MEETLFIILIIIIIFIVTSKYNINKDISIIKSTVDNRNYRVLKSDNELEAANLLAHINNDVIKLINSLSNEKDKKYKRLIKNYNPDSLNENLDNNNYKAYSLNKGEEIVICIRNKDNTLINDKNTILFVIIHELSHIMTKETGHPPIFWENMNLLLKKANEIGIYEPIDYNKYPTDYCGMIIDNSPYQF